MAIYRLEKKSISRGQGHNLVAAVSYRAAAKLTDTNKLNPNAKTHDYTQKGDVVYTQLLKPKQLQETLKTANIDFSIADIANTVESGEVTKRGKLKESAKLASEYILAGSHELSLEDNIEIFNEFAARQVEEQGVVAIVCVHDPSKGTDISRGSDVGDNSKTGDKRNIHAHIVLLSRQLELKGDQLKLGKKSDSELSDTDRKKQGLQPSKVWLKSVREGWAEIQNKKLTANNIANVTHKSYKSLNLPLKPTIPLGKDLTAMVRMGFKTKKAQNNERIKRENERKLLELTSSQFTKVIRDAELRKRDAELRKRNINYRASIGERDTEYTDSKTTSIKQSIAIRKRDTERRERDTERREQKIREIEGNSRKIIAVTKRKTVETHRMHDISFESSNTIEGSRKEKQPQIEHYRVPRKRFRR